MTKDRIFKQVIIPRYKLLIELEVENCLQSLKLVQNIKI